MGSVSRVHTFSSGAVLTAAQLNNEFDNLLTSSAINGGLDATNLGVTAGQATASKALVIDSSRNLDDGTTSNQINNLVLSGTLTVAGATTQTGALSIDDTTDSTSTTTGSIHTDGGVGIAKDLIVGNDVKVGGGYGATGATISTAGVGQFNGALTTDGALTGASLVCTAAGTFGGGYGATGATISTAGVIQANGAITSDGAVTGATLAGTISTAAQNSITSASSLATVGTITSGTWSGVIDGSATMTLGSDATGDIYYRDASGFLERLASGADGTVLTGTGAGAIPAWESPTVGDITSVVAGAGMTGGGTTGDVTLNVIGGNGITANADDVAITAAQTTVTSVYNASLKMGRDSQNLIDFATTDNKIILRVNNVDEVELVADTLQPTTSDGVALGTASLMWSDLFLASGSVINFAAGDVTLTHSSETLTVAGGTLAAAGITGTTIDATTDFTIGDTVITDGVITDTSGLSVASATTVASTLTVGANTDGHDVKFFGNATGSYMEWDESADQLRILGPSTDAAGSSGKLLLATAQTAVAANDILGQIDFQAPLETGTDATAIAAAIKAVAQDTFSATVNSTDLIFYTGHSEAATEKFRMTSQGELGVGGANYGTDGQVLTSAGAGAAVAWESVSAGVSLSGSTNNTIATVTGANALIGEANLTFDGSVLAVTGAVTMANAAGPTIVNEAATATNPTLIPNKAEVDTGYGWAAADTLTVITGGTERMRIDSAGKVGIGTAAPTALLHLNSTAAEQVIQSTEALEAARIRYINTSGDYRVGVGARTGGGDFEIKPTTGGVALGISMTSAGAVTIGGSLSKSSGSFRIRHPLESRDGYDLVHSFLEGPQADLLYRGTATLSAGTATVNIDTAARMTDGTFVALVNNVQAFTTNESGFDNVRASVSGNVLTITSEDDTSTASISWLVVGERKDAHMLDTDWTDADGRVITEPETVVEPDWEAEGVEAEPVEESA